MSCIKSSPATKTHAGDTKQDNRLNQSSINSSVLNDKSIFLHLEEAENLDKICRKLSEMTKEYLGLKENNITLSKQMQVIESQYKSESI